MRNNDYLDDLYDRLFKLFMVIYFILAWCVMVACIVKIIYEVWKLLN